MKLGYGILVAACLLLLAVGGVWWYGTETERLIDLQNRATGRLLVDQIMLVKHWEGLENEQAFLPIVHDLTERLSKHKYHWRLICPDSPDNAKQPRDQFEKAVLAQFMEAGGAATAEARVPEFAERVAADGQYQYYQPIRAERSCLGVCHQTPPGGISGESTASGAATSEPAKKPLAEGDLMAVVAVSFHPASRRGP